MLDNTFRYQRIDDDDHEDDDDGDEEAQDDHKSDDDGEDHDSVWNSLKIRVLISTLMMMDTRIVMMVVMGKQIMNKMMRVTMMMMFPSA